jgi:hypothetical protein
MHVLNNNTEVNNMLKLIRAYSAMPSPSNRAKLQKHIQAHPMALCFLTAEETAFLRSHEFKL